MSYDFRERTASKKPLYGHVSPDTAYVIDDYPSGFKARCRKRVWLEFKAKTGWRLVSQTSEKWYPGEEPAKDAALRWNKPDASTYVQIAACMYLDSQDHVQWDGLGFNSSEKPNEVLEFMKEFPKADFGGIKALVVAKYRQLKAKLLGQVAMTMNGKVQPWSDHELGEARKDLEQWAGIGAGVGLPADQEMKDLIDGKIEAKKIDPEAVHAQMKLREEEAAAAQAEEVKKTPGALSYNGFVEYLKKSVKLDDRTLSIRAAGSWGFGMLYVDFLNLPETFNPRGVDAENNRQTFSIEGFDKKDADKAVAKVKVEMRINHVGENSREGHAKTNLRSKSGPPAKVAEYLAAHISKMVKEYEPRTRL